MKTPTQTFDMYSAFSAKEGDDPEIFLEALENLIAEGMNNEGRDGAWNGVDFHSTDTTKACVVNQVEGMIEDEEIDSDVHLAKITVQVSVEYL